MFFLKLRTFAVMVALVCAATLLHSQDVKDLPQPTDYVSDFAHVMSPTAIRQIGMLCGQVDRQAHAQIAVVTVNTVNGQPVQDYAVQLYEKWKIGAKGSDRGVLILIATQDRKRWIATGYGLESILPDGKVGQIGRQMVPLLRNNDFDGALTLAVDEIAQIIANDAGVTLTPLTTQGREYTEAQPVHLSLGKLIIGAIFLFLILAFLARAGGGGLLGFLLGMFLGGGGRGGGWGGGGGFGGGGGGGGDGFGGFGGGSTGGGGAGGDW